MSAKQNNSINKLSFEQAIKELTGIVAQVEQGQIPLADSLQQYEKGMAYGRSLLVVEIRKLL